MCFSDAIGICISCQLNHGSILQPKIDYRIVTSGTGRKDHRSYLRDIGQEDTF